MAALLSPSAARTDSRGRRGYAITFHVAAYDGDVGHRGSHDEGRKRARGRASDSETKVSKRVSMDIGDQDQVKEGRESGCTKG